MLQALIMLSQKNITFRNNQKSIKHLKNVEDLDTFMPAYNPLGHSDNYLLNRENYGIFVHMTWMMVLMKTLMLVLIW